MFYKNLLFFFGITWFIMGCASSIDNKFKYPNTDEIDLRIDFSNIHLVVAGRKFFINREAILFVTVLDKNFGIMGDAELDCFIVDNRKRLYAESLEELSPGYFEIVLKPTRSGRAKIIFNVKGKGFGKTVKLDMVIND